MDEFSCYNALDKMNVFPIVNALDEYDLTFRTDQWMNALLIDP